MNEHKNIIWSPDKVSRLWGYYAQNSSYVSQYFSYHSGKYILKYLSKYLGLKSKKVLDFGCGPGYLIKNISLYSPDRIYGLDFSKESIDKVNKDFKGEPYFDSVKMVKKLPSSLADKSVDVVIAVEVIEHLDDQQFSETLKEINRVLVPGGFVVLTTPHREDLEANKTICPDCGCIFHRWQHIRSFDVLSLEKILEEENFGSVHVKATVFGGLTKRAYFYLKKIFNKHFDYPHLIYIGKKRSE